MGQEASSTVKEDLENFNIASKSGVGPHLFRFKRSKRAHAAANDSDPRIIYIGSEVTDVNGILDVTYHVVSLVEPTASTEQDQTLENQRQVFGRISSLRGNEYDATRVIDVEEGPIWKPTHTFSSGRVAMIAVDNLLRRDYKMKNKGS